MAARFLVIPICMKFEAFELDCIIVICTLLYMHTRIYLTEYLFLGITPAKADVLRTFEIVGLQQQEGFGDNFRSLIFRFWVLQHPSKKSPAERDRES